MSHEAMANKVRIIYWCPLRIVSNPKVKSSSSHEPFFWYDLHISALAGTFEIVRSVNLKRNLSLLQISQKANEKN